MRQEIDIERVDPQTLEIALIERFKKKLKDIRLAITQEDEDNDPNKSLIEVQQDGNGLHYSYRGCHAHNSEEFFVYFPSETGETIACEATEYEKDQDNTICIKRIVRGQIRVRDGILVQSINPGIFESALNRLSQIEKKMTTPPAAQPAQEVPLTSPLVFH